AVDERARGEVRDGLLHLPSARLAVGLRPASDDDGARALREGETRDFGGWRFEKGPASVFVERLREGRKRRRPHGSKARSLGGRGRIRSENRLPERECLHGLVLEMESGLRLRRVEAEFLRIDVG